MRKEEVGRIKNLSINEDTGQLEVLIIITNGKFRKKLLRDLSLSGNIIFDKDKVVFTGNNKE
jgi:sporulation protein YlmC with PRC-barrel domain|tara:strand:- start:6203 stop:6388 length:186 start_codon:yes stop_codon:yes gene_type:complete